MATAVTTRQFYGSGGAMGGSKSPTQTADNLFSMDVVEALLGVSEGPIEGLAPGGARNFYIGETPLLNVDDKPNFDSFELILRKGNELGQEITSRLGGFGSSTTVQTELASNTPVVRQGSHTNIDYLDIRLAITRLVQSTDKGTFEHTGRVKLEYKRTSSPTWLPVNTVQSNPPQEAFNGVDAEVYVRLEREALISGAEGDALTFWQASAPVVNSNQPVIWFSTADLNRPYRQSGGAWSAYPNATPLGGAGWNFDGRTAHVTSAAPPSRQRGDFWLNPSNNTVHFFNGSAWVKAGSTLSPGAFFGQGTTGGSSSLSAGEISLRGKASGTYVKELRIPVNRLSDDTYDIRVTKTSPDNTTELFFDVQWESFQEVTARSFNFPALSTVQLTARASDQFSSIPDFWGVYRGRIVRVPSNYNPITRVYTGLWDGTWKMAWSNNPAYIVNDLVSNDRYGLNAYYPVVLNKFDVYEAGQWCDTLRADGKPRFTYNGLISEPRGCREAIDYICGTFGGRFFDDGNGSATIKIDKDDQASALFSPENVAGGLFTYSFTETASRYNDITVTFVNPELRWKEDRRRVHDENHIARYGRIPLNFVAVGCTNVAEAIARGRYKLATGIHEKTIVTFKTNRAGLYLKPYEVILIADDDVEHGLHGRVLEQTGPRSFLLRDPVYMEAGATYTVSFQIPDLVEGGYKLVQLPVQAAVGNQLSITTTANLPELPEDAVFALSSTTGSNPKPFRVTKIDEIEGDPDNVEIQAIEIYRQKWTFVDGLIEEITPPAEYVLDISAKPHPPARIYIEPEVVNRGGLRVNNLSIDWEPSESKTVIKYKVFASRNNNPLTLVTETSGTAYEMLDVMPGEYLICVIACTPQMESNPVYAEHRLIGDIRDISKITNLKLVNETGNVFTTANPKFSWDAVMTVDHEDYVVRVYDQNTNLLREVVTRTPEFTYDLTMNKADNGGTPIRTLQVWVAARDQYQQLTPFTILTVTNPAPPAVVPLLQVGMQSVYVSWDLSAIPDAVGVKIWVSEQFGFTPSPATLVYNGPGASLTRYGEANKTYYLRIAVYDALGDVGLVVSPQYEFVPEAIDLGEFDGVFSDVADFVVGTRDHDLAARLDELQRSIEEVSLRATTGTLRSWDDRQTIRTELSAAQARFNSEINVGRIEREQIANRLVELEVFEGDARAHFLQLEEVRASDIIATAEQFAELISRFGDTEALIADLASTVASGELALAQDLSALEARLGTAEGLISTETTARATADTALAQQLSTLQARVGAAESAVDTETAARVDADNALAATQTTLTAQYNDMSATGRVGFQVAAGVSGVTARYAIVLRANTAATYSEAGLYVQILTNGKTQVGIKADDFVLLNQTGEVLSSPFYVTGGRVYINNAYIKDLTSESIDVDVLSALTANLGLVTAGRLQSPDGKVVLDLNEKFLSMEA